jgi:hypothetical protein
MKPQPTFCVSVNLKRKSECEALASLRHTYLGSFFLEDPENIKSLSLGAIWNFIEGTWLTGPGISMGHKGPAVKA